MRAEAEDPARAREPVRAPERPRRPTAAERDAAAELERLEAEASYHRDRLALYHARVVTARPSSPARLRELQRASASADARLTHAKRGRAHR
jgi:hypothetical protein